MQTSMCHTDSIAVAIPMGAVAILNMPNMACLERYLIPARYRSAMYTLMYMQYTLPATLHICMRIE